MDIRYAIPEPVEYWEVSMLDFVEGRAPDWVKEMTYDECDAVRIVIYDPCIDDTRVIFAYEGKTYLVNYGHDHGVYGFDKKKMIFKGSTRYNEFMTLDELIAYVEELKNERKDRSLESQSLREE